MQAAECGSVRTGLYAYNDASWIERLMSTEDHAKREKVQREKGYQAGLKKDNQLGDKEKAQRCHLRSQLRYLGSKAPAPESAFAAEAARSGRIPRLRAARQADFWFGRPLRCSAGRIARGANLWSFRGVLCIRSRHIHSELDCIGSRLRPQVVHASLQAQLPAVEMHGRELRGRAISHVNIQALTLADVRRPISGHFQDALLLDLPDRLVELFQVCGDVKALHRPIQRDKLLLQIVIPEATFQEVRDQVTIDLDELTSEHSSHVDVLRVRLKGFGVPEDLRRGRRGHRGHKQRVTQAVVGDLGFQRSPIPPAGFGRDAPEVELELALRRR